MANSRNDQTESSSTRFCRPADQVCSIASDTDPKFSAAMVQALKALPLPARYAVAFSGGPDSTALLSALAGAREDIDAPIRALHVNHQLQDQAAGWADHCKEICRKLDVDFSQIDVSVMPHGGPESSARAARYAALDQTLEPDEMLLTGHHQSDQAETLLLRLLRGSGVKGLGSIRPVRRFGRGWLARPLLKIPRKHIIKYLQDIDLEYIMDPTNLEPEADRNFLRNAIIPSLEERWPGQATTLTRTAELMSETHDLLEAIAADDLQQLATDSQCCSVSIAELSKLSTPRQALLLRHLVAMQDLPMPSRARLDSLIGALQGRRSSAMIRWQDSEIRCYRDRLHVMSTLPPRPEPGNQAWIGNSRFDLPHGLGELQLRHEAGGTTDGIPDALQFQVGFRNGGERIVLPGRTIHHKLKKLWQADDVPPWVRRRTPLVWKGDSLWAVGNRWRSGPCAAWLATHRIRLAWKNCTVEELPDE